MQLEPGNGRRAATRGKLGIQNAGGNEIQRVTDIATKIDLADAFDVSTFMDIYAYAYIHARLNDVYIYIYICCIHMFYHYYVLLSRFL